MAIRLPQIWLGSEESYTQHLINRLNYLSDPNAFKQFNAFKGFDEEDANFCDYLSSRIVDIVGNVGLVKISGPLVADEGIHNLIFGETAYQTISAAIKLLLENQDVIQILTIWDTPGGDASGVNDFGAFLKDADKVKPIHAWTGTMVLSAGYWGAACCRSIRASELGEIGSIGAIAKFRSFARMLKEEGIDTIIARSAPMKAVLQTEEPIDDSKRAYLQSKVDQYHAFFVDHIKRTRPGLREIPDDKWATGETFFANKAYELGLIDGPIISLNALVSQIQSKIDKDKSNPTTRTGKKMMTVLSDQVIAQLMNGVIPPEVVNSSPSVPDNICGTQDAHGKTTDKDETKGEAENDKSLELDAAEAINSEDKQTFKDDSLVNYLQNRVSSLEAKVIELTLRAEKAEADLVETKMLSDLLRPIVIEATQRLQVALGQTPGTFAEIPSRALANCYRSTLAEFEKRFQPGRRSLQAQDDSRQPKTLAELRLMSSGR